MSYRKLNVGCGFDKREGYTNVDLNSFHAPDLVADIINIFQVEDGAAEEVLANDVLEHVPGTRVMPALVEWNRLLCRGGELRLRVPDLVSVAKMIISGEQGNGVIDMLYGTQSYIGDFHMSGFTSKSLTSMLDQSGFALSSLEVTHGWLLSASARKVRSVRSRAFELAKNEKLNDLEYVKAIYVALLDREADDGGLQHFANSLAEGVRDRYQIISTIFHSDEGRAKGARLVEAANER